MYQVDSYIYKSFGNNLEVGSKDIMHKMTKFGPLKNNISPRNYGKELVSSFIYSFCPIFISKKCYLFMQTERRVLRNIKERSELSRVETFLSGYKKL